MTEARTDLRELTVAGERGDAAPSGTCDDGLSRRRWLQLMGASLALSGAAGCRYQVERIAPYVFRPENRHPGDYLRYATVIDHGGVGAPLLVNTIDGRPIKIDGNPDHPDAQGAADLFCQSRILDLYDPDRSTTPSRNAGTGREPLAWPEFLAELRSRLDAAAGNQGASLAILAEPNSSPTLGRLRQQLLEKLPAARWYEYSPLHDDHEVEGLRQAFGQSLRPIYALDRCRILLCVDADLLSYGGPAVRASRQLADRRDPDGEWMSRIYCVESQFSLLGGTADHRLALPPSAIPAFVAALEGAVAAEPAAGPPAGDARDRFLAALVDDLRQHRQAACVVCGPQQPPEVHAAVWRINQALGALGSTVTLVPRPERPPHVQQIRDLTAALDGFVTTLIVLGGNPVYDAPSDLKFADALGKVKTSVHLALSENETSQRCTLFANVAHPLEAWGDARSTDGSYCIAQPMIAPLYGSRSTIEVLAEALGDAQPQGLSLVRQTAQTLLSGADFETAWAETVHRGFADGTAAAAVEVGPAAGPPLAAGPWKREWDGGTLELLFVPSRQQLDGRFANCGWLQELPDFITKMTWDNAAILSPRTARQLGLRQGQIVSIPHDGDRRVDLPVHIQPGHARGTVTLTLGYGRTRAGRVGGDVARGVPAVGVDVYRLRTSDAMFTRGEVSLVGTTGRRRLALTQDPFQTDASARDGIRRRLGDEGSLIRSGTLDDYRRYVAEHGGLVDSAYLRTEHDPPPAVAEAEARRRALPVISAVDGSSHAEPRATGHADRLAEPHGGEHAEYDPLHAPQWPEGHALHFENMSLSSGPYYSAVHKWGLSIDLSRCLGCNACVIACQSENNIPVVGREQVLRGRELHWMRIDAYFVEAPVDADAEEAVFKFQPVACQQCENAPCETVCPVAATVHSDEGLNDMVYNRCVGTRYCGNNCPYKVRRFNYLNYSEAVTFIKYPNEGQYSEREKQLRGLAANPEVTVRSRGVMEKCTYCVQRIQNAKIRARNEHRALGPNEITTACQDACPAGAIRFGNLADPASDVHARHRSVRAYQLLGHLNNQPRTRYLARVRNPHPWLAPPPPTAAP